MKLFTWHRCALALMLLPLSGALLAETKVDPEKEAAWEERSAVVRDKIEQATAAKAEALARYQAQKTACFERFLVSACQAEAKRAYNTAVLDSERAVNQAKADERQIKRERLADKDARHAIDAAEAASKLPERENDTLRRREQAEAKRAEKLKSQEQHAEEGERRRLEREARVAKKQAEHDAEVARRIDKAGTKAGESAPAH